MKRRIGNGCLGYGGLGYGGLGYGGLGYGSFMEVPKTIALPEILVVQRCHPIYLLKSRRWLIYIVWRHPFINEIESASSDEIESDETPYRNAG